MIKNKLSQIGLIVLLGILPTSAIQARSPQSTEAERQFDAASERFREGTPEAITDAIAGWETALKLWRELGDTDGETKTLKALGDAYLKLGEYGRSFDYHRDYLSLLNPEDEMKASATLGDYYRTRQQYEQALELHRIFLTRVREIAASEIEEANALSRVGYTYFLAGQYQPALELYQRSLAMRREIGDRVGEIEKRCRSNGWQTPI